MQVIFGGFSHIGKTRQSNQDSLFIRNVVVDNVNVCLAVVCDGVGGLVQGDMASVSTAFSLKEWFDNMVKNGVNEYAEYCKGLCECIKNTNTQIQQYSEQIGIKTGTTVCAILIIEDHFFVVNIGDSRIYKAADTLYQLTQDHSVVELRENNGKISEKKLLTQCVGYKNELEIFSAEGWTKQGDVFLICSDGFYERMKPKEILLKLEKISIKTDIDKLAEKLIIEVMQREKKDNISVGIVKIV